MTGCHQLATRSRGYFAEVTLFGVKRVYRVANVAVGRAVITSGAVQHVEIELERLDREV